MSRAQSLGVAPAPLSTSGASTALQRIATQFAAQRPQLPALAVSEQVRAAALAALLARGLPGARDGDWKYMDWRALERAHFSARAGTTALPPPLRARVQAALPASVAGFSRQVFVDGRHEPSLSDRESGSGRIQFSTAVAPSSHDAPPMSLSVSPDTRMVELNALFLTDRTQIDVVASAMPSSLELVFVATQAASTGVIPSRVDVRLAANSTLELLERHIGIAEGDSFSNHVLSLDIAQNAHLQHVLLQTTAVVSQWYGSYQANLAADARFEHYGVSQGAAAARLAFRVQLDGARAMADYITVALGTDTQILDHQVVIEHRAANVHTRQIYRGIAAGRSRVAFNGHMIVRAAATGTDVGQSLRSLIDGPGAEADARPQLEIYTDAIRASHGATTGKLDEQMMFYLLSRGLDRDTATGLLKRAFIADAFTGLQSSALHAAIDAVLPATLRRATLSNNS